MRLKQFFKEEIRGWKTIEVAWLLLCSLILLSLSLFWKDSVTSTLGALTGIWCVILTGKGKRSAFLFGILNVLFYSYTSWQARYYGEVMLNLLYFLPMNFVGWFVWTKHMDPVSHEVKRCALPIKKKCLLYTLTAVGIFLYGVLLQKLGGSLPYLDSMSTIISISAQILAVWRMAEQWTLWTVVNAVTVGMWTMRFFQSGEGIAMIAMWSLYLINGLILMVKWNREIKQKEG